jgi:hypothetical protein
LETKLIQIRLGSSSGLGSIKERRFTIVGGINNTPINNDFLGSHKHSSVGISCPRLPHEGPSLPIATTTRTVIVNMVTSLIESTKMDEDEYEVLLVNPKRTFKSPAKAIIESFVDEEYANCPSPPKKQKQGTLES